jgi:cell division protein FtsL
MSAYINGNLALQPTHTTPSKANESNHQITKKQNIRTKQKLAILFIVVAFFAITFMILFRYVQVYQMNTEILNIQKEMKQIHLENELLKQEIEKLQSPDRLKQEAVKLGLVPRNQSQVAQIKPTQTTNTQLAYQR